MSSGRTDAPSSPTKEATEWLTGLRSELGLSAPTSAPLGLDGLDGLDGFDGLDTPLSEVPMAPPVPVGPTSTTPPTLIRVKGPTGDLVKLQQARLLWTQAWAKAGVALEATAAGIEADFDDGEAARAVRSLLRSESETLVDALDDLLATPASQRARAAAREAATATLEAASGDVVLRVLDGSPYTSASPGETLVSALTGIRDRLS